MRSRGTCAKAVLRTSVSGMCSSSRITRASSENNTDFSLAALAVACLYLSRSSSAAEWQPARARSNRSTTSSVNHSAPSLSIATSAG